MPISSTQFCKTHGGSHDRPATSLPADIVKNRVRRYGWTLDDALSTPVQTRQKREPWLDHGMSRSAYYRAKKEGLISFTVEKKNIDG